MHRSKSGPLMSALGQKQTLRHRSTMSALPPKADIASLPRSILPHLSGRPRLAPELSALIETVLKMRLIVLALANLREFLQ